MACPGPGYDPHAEPDPGGAHPCPNPPDGHPLSRVATGPAANSTSLRCRSAASQLHPITLPRSSDTAEAHGMQPRTVGAAPPLERHHPCTARADARGRERHPTARMGDTGSRTGAAVMGRTPDLLRRIPRGCRPRNQARLALHHLHYVEALPSSRRSRPLLVVEAVYNRMLHGVSCMFCHGASGSSLSKEHLLSVPVCRAFKINREALIRRINGRTGVVSSTARLEETQVRLPCQRCNSGWMNELEDGMESLVAPWTRGHGGHLGGTAENVLMRWSLKTHIVLAALEGGTRAFASRSAESKPSVLPEATRARNLYAGENDATAGIVVGVARVASSNYLWGFGNPRVLPIGPKFANARSASVTCLNLGEVQLWIVVPAIPSATVRLPPKVRRVTRHLDFGRLTYAPSSEPDLGAAVVDNGHHDIDDVFARAMQLMSGSESLESPP